VKDIRRVLINHVKALGGIKTAPDSPTEDVGVYPFAVCYPRTGYGQGGTPGVLKGFHRFFVEIHCSRTLLPQAIEQAEKYIEPFLLALLNDPTLDDTVSNIVVGSDSLTYDFGRLEWAGIETIGIRFTVTVKNKVKE
jgi:hypothetical protein